MQAIFETLFDIVYLVTVITLGIRMIRNSRGERQIPAVRCHGGDAGLRRCIPSGAPGDCPLHHRTGTLYSGTRHRQAGDHWTYNIGVPLMAIMLAVRGVAQVGERLCPPPQMPRFRESRASAIV